MLAVLLSLALLAQPVDSADAVWQSYLDRIVSRTDPTDYLQARIAYANSSSYRPGAVTYQRVRNYLDTITYHWDFTGDSIEAAHVSRRAVEEFPLHPDVLQIAAAAYAKIWMADSSEYYRSRFDRVISSISTENSGYTEGQAKTIIDTYEAYAYFTHMKYRVINYRATTGNGHFYDVYKVQNREGLEAEIYFLVDIQQQYSPLER